MYQNGSPGGSQMYQNGSPGGSQMHQNGSPGGSKMVAEHWEYTRAENISHL